MATALSMGNGTGNAAKSKTAQKTQEKRGTNPNSPDADERVPKRRLVRSNTEENKTRFDFMFKIACFLYRVNTITIFSNRVYK